MARSALSVLCKCDDACFQDEAVEWGSEILFAVTLFTSRSSNAMDFGDLNLWRIERIESRF